jgi:hypothetical protein
MPKEPTVQTTVEAMMKVFGSDAADEAKRMADRMSMRKDPSGSDFWHQVYLALRGEKPETRSSATIETSLSA